MIVSAHSSSLQSWPGSCKLYTQLLRQWDEVGKQLRTELCSPWTPDISCLTLYTCNSFLVEDHRAEGANKYLGSTFEAGVPSLDISCALGDSASCLFSSCEWFVWGLGVQKGSSLHGTSTTMGLNEGKKCCAVNSYFCSVLRTKIHHNIKSDWYLLSWSDLDFRCVASAIWNKYYSFFRMWGLLYWMHTCCLTLRYRSLI